MAAPITRNVGAVARTVFRTSRVKRSFTCDYNVMLCVSLFFCFVLFFLRLCCRLFVCVMS